MKLTTMIIGFHLWFVALLCLLCLGCLILLILSRFGINLP